MVGLEQYLKGVVPSEMPSKWPAAALEAQAVAARSYALANLTKGRPYDLYGDARSQVYGGIDGGVACASAAVDATKGQVVLYNGKVANTLFFSTSGGRTVVGARGDRESTCRTSSRSRIRTTRSRRTTTGAPCSTTRRRSRSS